jgi:hypothetical protein
MSVDIGLCLPPALVANLRDQGTGSPVVRYVNQSVRKIRDAYAGTAIGIEWTTGLPNRTGPHTLPLAEYTTLGRLLTGPGDQATFERIVAPVVPLGRLRDAIRSTGTH